MPASQAGRRRFESARPLLIGTDCQAWTYATGPRFLARSGTAPKTPFLVEWGKSGSVRIDFAISLPSQPLAAPHPHALAGPAGSVSVSSGCGCAKRAPERCGAQPNRRGSCIALSKIVERARGHAAAASDDPVITRDVLALHALSGSGILAVDNTYMWPSPASRCNCVNVLPESILINTRASRNALFSAVFL